ncbi:GNAT family N-acetyltransferase [Musicola paradisiaca]|uniref:GCN5-related N-acetyltransferase n=1 Tax=Musicola paradisiaca (strain Ech703) TaxID=579405 RepID=C6C8W3_MUSP7|nr:GNAT family N-acetyltransferase [Musicola paradisiaca]ACS84334.1 GCN5-related N-acetyltransferase [Musicola paradisiaca Ech703]
MSAERFIISRPDDPRIVPIIDDLFNEYRQRYGDYFGQREPDPVTLYLQPDGIFVVLLHHHRPIATGAFKRYDATTAELKRIWTDKTQRRQGLARRVLRELEHHARRLGYCDLFLTTGFRQPEAVGLYLSEGYQPQFDPSIDPEYYSQPPHDGRLPFRKPLYPFTPVPDAASVNVHAAAITDTGDAS